MNAIAHLIKPHTGRFAATFIFILALLHSAFSQTTQLGGYASNGDYVGFLRFLPPGYESATTKFPLIIFLHGRGEKGNGTTELAKVQCCGIPAYIKGGNDMQFTWNGKTEGFIVLTPQLDPKYETWQPFYIDELINYALRSLKVDPDRIFLTGLSLGGGGIWYYASSSLNNAKKLAGIVPVVAPCFIRNTCNIAQAGLPVFAIHALDDGVAPASCTINAIRMINDCNPLVTPNVVLYKSGGHLVFMNRAYDTAHAYQDPNVYEWMLAQNRRLTPNKKPVARMAANTSITNGTGTIFLDATHSSDPDGKLVSCSWERLPGPQTGSFIPLLPGQAELTGLTTPGTYSFVVKVVDDRAEWSTDTVSVLLSADASPVNEAPLAVAGPDIWVGGTASFATLNGLASTDPDGRIAGYLWTQLEGPATADLSTPQQAVTKAMLPVPGNYSFRLLVMDNLGALSTDVITVTKSAGGDDIVVSRPPPAGDTTISAFSPEDPVYHEITDASNLLTVFPNPASSTLEIRTPPGFPAEITLRLYNSTGQLALVRRQSAGDRLNISSLRAGAYTIEVMADRHPPMRARFIKIN